MPSKSAKQHRFMEAIAHNAAFAKKAGVPQSVGKDFSAADKGKKFAGGSEMKGSKPKMPPKPMFGGKAPKAKKFAKGGSIDGCATKGKTKGKVF